MNMTVEHGEKSITLQCSCTKDELADTTAIVATLFEHLVDNVREHLHTKRSMSAKAFWAKKKAAGAVARKRAWSSGRYIGSRRYRKV